MADSKVREDRFIKVGKVLRPVGLKGRVLLHAFSSLENILVPGSFFLKSPSGRYEEFFVLSHRLKNPRELVARVKWVDSREKAEKISGMEIYQRVSRLPQAEEDEFYWFQLKGLRVQDGKGHLLGTIHSVLETGASDVLVVRDENREILIPMVEGVIKKVDPERGICLVELPPGLVDATVTLFKPEKQEGGSRPPSNKTERS